MTPEARQNEALQTRTTIGFSEVTGIISPQTELLLLRHPLESFPERELQIDHRIPFEVKGDVPGAEAKPGDYMLLCGSANRAKSWSCEHCVNWLELRKAEICRRCYWAYPDDYSHVAMREARRADILWTGAEVESYDKLKRRTLELQKNIPDYVKEIIEIHLKGEKAT